MKSFREDILVLLTCPILFFLLSTFLQFCCFPLRPFPSHPLSKPNFLAFGASWFFCCCCRDCCCVCFFSSFLVHLPFFVCVCCFALRFWHAVFPAILCFFFFFEWMLLSPIQKKGFRQLERCFARFSPPKALFSKTLSVCHSLLSFYSSVFPFNIPCFCFHQPFLR